MKTILTDDSERIENVYRYRKNYYTEDVLIRGVGHIERVIYTDGKRFFAKWYHEFREIEKDSFGRFVSVGIY